MQEHLQQEAVEEEVINMEEKNNIICNQVDPTTFEYQQYTEKDTVLISSSRLDTVFSNLLWRARRSTEELRAIEE